MRKQKRRQLTEQQLVHKLVRLINKYGRVRVTVQDIDADELCDCLCKQCRTKYKPNMRRRLIQKSGRCLVSYCGEEYTKWSGYQTSCFWEELIDNRSDEWCDKCENYKYECMHPIKVSPKDVVEAMLYHDSDELKPILVEYGPRFSRRERL